MNDVTPELEEKTEVPAPPRAVSGVVLVRGDAFFARRLELPAATPPSEVPGFVALQLEELAPFPLDQLYHGFVRSSDGRAVFVYAAYRRRFTADQIEGWPRAQFVLPDFAPVLRLKFPSATVVYLRSEATLTAMLFDADQELPVRVASRPLAADAPYDAVDRVRDSVRALVEARTAHEFSWRAASAPEPRAKGLQFFFESDGSGGGREVFVPGADCWAMDVRDPEFIAQQRKRLGFDLVLWRVVLGAAAAIVVLLFGEVLLGAVKGYASWLDNHNDRRAPAVASIRDRDLAATRLEEFGESGGQPFDMLSVAGRAKPSPVYFTRTTAKGATRLEIEGWAPDVASVNQYENALKAAPNVQSIEVRRVTPATGGSSFSIAITFATGAFSRGAGVARAQQ